MGLARTVHNVFRFNYLSVTSRERVQTIENFNNAVNGITGTGHKTTSTIKVFRRLLTTKGHKKVFEVLTTISQTNQNV